MVIYHVLVDGKALSIRNKKLAGLSTLIGWNDVGGDPVFVAVYGAAGEWRSPARSLAFEVAKKEMKRRLDLDMGPPDYGFEES
jgi:hypothetical protein